MVLMKTFTLRNALFLQFIIVGGMFAINYGSPHFSYLANVVISIIGSLPLFFYFRSSRRKSWALLSLNFLAMNFLLLAMPVANVSSKRLRAP
ncbi:hypothetical protein QFZ80_002997 [Paenibacillus sp. V4I7]|nr:hypothetical protein [Paenibacillus sp. V4I7]